MEYNLGDRISISYTGRTTEYSKPVPLAGANAAQPAFVVLEFSLSGGDQKVYAYLQVSNDQENWADFGAGDELTGTGYTLGTKHTGIAAAYARMKIEASATTSGTVALAMTLSTSMQ